VGFDVTGQLLIIYSALSTAFIKYFKKKWNTMRQCINYLETSGMPMIQ
jgi:hypothetical protein